jgi:hypothetical protein
MTLDNRVVEAGFDSTIRSTIWTGRPLRAAATSYIRDWEYNRRHELNELLSKGIIPMDHEIDALRGAGGLPEEVVKQSAMRCVASIFPPRFCAMANRNHFSTTDLWALRAA